MSLKLSLKYFLYAIVLLFGMYFFYCQLSGLGFTLKTLANLHKNTSLLYLFDLLPIAVIPLVYIFQNKINILNNNFEQLTVSEHERAAKIVKFTEELSKGNTEYSYEITDQQDEMGKSLLDLRDSLLKKIEDEKIFKQQNEQRNWTNQGLARFADILRKDNDDIDKLSYNILSNLIKYLEANQGGFFIINDNDSRDEFLELKAMYAYDRRKFEEKTIKPGEGLAGTCWIEKESIFLTDVPDKYTYITSGIGEATPNCVLITPIKVNDEVFGVIEIASFKVLEQFEIEFVEKLSENIASTISGVKVNIKTSILLEQSQKQADAMREQEEAMRQNMEELKATQEEAARQSEQLASFTNSVNHTLIRAEYDTSGKLLYANTKFLDKLGYSSTREVDNQHITMFIDKKDKEWFLKIWETLAAGGKHFEGYMKHITKDGKDLWTMATYVCVRTHNGGVEKILFLAIDNTEQKKQGLDFEGQINALNHGSVKIEIDTEANIISTNSLFIEMFGYTKEDTSGNSLYSFISGNHGTTIKNYWEKLLDKQFFKGEVQFNTKLGVERWLQCSLSPVKDLYDEVVKIILIGHDITEQKRMEQETIKQAEALKLQETELRKHLEELEQVQIEMNKKNLQIENEKTKTFSILEGCIEGIVTFNKDGIIEMFNKTASDITGFDKNIAIGTKIDAVLAFEIKGKDITYKGNGENREIQIDVKTEIMAKHISGSEVPVLLTLTRIEGANETTFTAFLQNIEVELF
ncbi:MAG: PAS domain S-box protein [Bacteroidota bacterium]